MLGHVTGYVSNDLIMVDLISAQSEFGCDRAKQARPCHVVSAASPPDGCEKTGRAHGGEILRGGAVADVGEIQVVGSGHVAAVARIPQREGGPIGYAGAVACCRQGGPNLTIDAFAHRERADLTQLRAYVSTDKRSYVDVLVESGSEACERPVIGVAVPPPPLFQRGELGTSKRAAVHGQGRENPCGASSAVLEGMNGRESHMNPGALDRWMVG